MTEQEYNAAEGIRRSDLWHMEDSPEKFQYFLEHPMEKTTAMMFGSACHKMILEPEDFGKEYAVAPQVDRRTKEGKLQWETFTAEHAGKEIISAEDAETMREMEEALEKCPLAWDLIRGDGQTEVPFFWTDPETGEKCKCKCDRLVNRDGRMYVIDFKTCTHADTERFNAEIFRLGYHFQAGMYTEGVRHILRQHGISFDDSSIGFMFVAQEKKAPYAVNVIEVSEDVMKIGVAKFHELLERYHECCEVDIFPGYVDDVPNETTLPGWWQIGEEE